MKVAYFFLQVEKQEWSSMTQWKYTKTTHMMSRLEPTTSTPLPSLDLLRVIGNYVSWKRKDEGEGKNNKFTFWKIYVTKLNLVMIFGD